MKRFQSLFLRFPKQKLGENIDKLGEDVCVLVENKQLLGENTNNLGKNKQLLGEFIDILAEIVYVLAEFIDVLAVSLNNLAEIDGIKTATNYDLSFLLKIFAKTLPVCVPNLAITDIIPKILTL